MPQNLELSFIRGYDISHGGTYTKKKALSHSLGSETIVKQLSYVFRSFVKVRIRVRIDFVRCASDVVLGLTLDLKKTMNNLRE